MQLWDNPNKEKREREMEKILLSPPPSPAADGVLGSGSANVYLCVFAGNWRILTVIIVRLIITTVKVSALRGEEASHSIPGPFIYLFIYLFWVCFFEADVRIPDLPPRPPRRPRARLT